MRLGIDLGGTKTEGLVLTPDGAERARMRVATPFDDYTAIIRMIAQLVERLEGESGSDRIHEIGIGMPGSLSPRSGLVRNSNSTCLNGHDIHADLTEATGRQIRLANDANCFALSEASDGAGLDARCVFGVILGTGVGGGLVFDGTVIEGRNLIGGEWGHNPLPGPEAMDGPLPVCYCGRAGCIEAYLSGPGLVNDHRQHANEHCETAEIVAAAADGQVPAAATMARYEERLARALASVMNLVDPDVIVLGGGLSNIGRLYENVPALLAGPVFSDVIDTRIVPAKHGDSSGVRGAAWLWPQMQDG
jgi:fructokinase